MIPVHITFRDVPKSDALEESIRNHADRLERFGDDLQYCHVSVEQPHHHHKHGNLYQVKVRLHRRGKDIMADANHRNHPSHEDVYVAVRDAFDAVRRQLE